MAIAVPTAATARPLVREDIYQRLYRQIISGQLAPGEVLRDKQIATAFGVSRTPVREAVRRLEDEGLVQTASNRWTRVAPLDLETALEQYAIIEALEVFALALAWPTLTGRDVRGLQESNVAMLRAARRGDGAAALAADVAFHAVWVDGCGNGELSRIIHQTKMPLGRIEIVCFSARGYAAQSFRQHRELMRAIRVFSLTQGIKALRHNWRGAARQIAVGAPATERRSQRDTASTVPVSAPNVVARIRTRPAR